MRFQTIEEFQAWYQKNRDKIKKFHREADVNSRRYHEVVYPNGKETYYLYGNPTEKSQNPRKAVWHVFRRDAWSPAKKHETFEEDKVYLVTGNSGPRALLADSGDHTRRIKDGRYSNPDGPRSSPYIIYIPPQDFYDKEERRYLGHGTYKPYTYKLVWTTDEEDSVKPMALSSWATAFVEYPIEVIGPSLNYPRGEFHG